MTSWSYPALTFWVQYGVMLFFRQIFIQGIDQSVHFSCPVFGQRVDLNDLASDLFGYGFGIIDIELTLDKRSYGYFFQGQIDDFFSNGPDWVLSFVFDRDLFHPVIGSKISQKPDDRSEIFCLFMISTCLARSAMLSIFWRRACNFVRTVVFVPDIFR